MPPQNWKGLPSGWGTRMWRGAEFRVPVPPSDVAVVEFRIPDGFHHDFRLGGQQESPGAAHWTDASEQGRFPRLRGNRGFPQQHFQAGKEVNAFQNGKKDGKDTEGEFLFAGTEGQPDDDQRKRPEGGGSHASEQSSEQGMPVRERDFSIGGFHRQMPGRGNPESGFRSREGQLRGSSAIAAGDRLPAVVRVRRGEGRAASGTFELFRAGKHGERGAAGWEVTTGGREPPFIFGRPSGKGEKGGRSPERDEDSRVREFPLVRRMASM